MSNGEDGEGYTASRNGGLPDGGLRGTRGYIVADLGRFRVGICFFKKLCSAKCERNAVGVESYVAGVSSCFIIVWLLRVSNALDSAL